MEGKVYLEDGSLFTEGLRCEKDLCRRTGIQYSHDRISENPDGSIVYGTGDYHDLAAGRKLRD